MSKLQEFFSKKWWLLVAPIIYAVGTLGQDIFFLVQGCKECAIYYFCSDAFMFIAIAITCISFLKHNKNVMKALVGGLLMNACLKNISMALDYSLCCEETPILVFGYVIAALSVAFFVTHLILASTHKANAKAINFNMVAGLLIPLFSIAFEIYICAIYFEVEQIVWGLLYICATSGIVLLTMNIESRVEYFKKLRDEKNAQQQEN